MNLNFNVDLEYTHDWVSSNQQTFNKVFKGITNKKNVRFLEVGSYEGRSAKYFLENILTGENNSLICVDVWNCDRVELLFDKSLLSTGKSNIVRKIKKRSIQALAEFPDCHFDGIYIDGSHSPSCILTDAIMGLRILKPGCVMLFDDYLWPKDKYKYHPKTIIDFFIDLHFDDLSVIHSGYQLAIKKNT